jgi:hypothetical protein
MVKPSLISDFEVRDHALSLRRDDCGEKCQHRNEKIVEASKMIYAIGYVPELIHIQTLCVHNINQVCQIYINKVK